MMYDSDLMARQVYGGLVGFDNEYVSNTTIVGKSFFSKCNTILPEYTTGKNTQHRKNVLHKNGRRDAPVKKLTI